MQFLPGHWALSFRKLPLVRFSGCAWLCRTNAPGLVSAVGATLAVARKPSPFQGEGAERSEADEGGSGMAEAPRRAGQCPALTAFTGQAFVFL